MRERVENSDFLVTFNPRFIEANSGSFTHQLPEDHVVNIGNQHISMDGEFYVGINSLDVLQDVVAALPVQPIEGASFQPEPFHPQPDAPLTQARVWQQIGEFIREGGVVIAEAGTSNIGLGPIRLPDGVQYINSPIWGSIGFTLPALLGSQMAAPKRRHLLFIGDGSFQLTVQELSTILREGQEPIIFLVNNRGYTIERFILGMKREYNDVANWKYADLVEVFAPGSGMQTFQARTEGELEQVLADVRGGAFIELHLDPFDAPAGLQKFGPATAEFDFGPRGPRNP
ncbi:thiamine pyrophosphate-dependent enzyme [Corynebacterium aquatimens]|uniref:thiamine pyrophosphate-dependent enzyme n=1 Tax=Corynebacterium aquatimens TaxID=1190508 RepID=UPI0033141A93